MKSKAQNFYNQSFWKLLHMLQCLNLSASIQDSVTVSANKVTSASSSIFNYLYETGFWKFNHFVTREKNRAKKIILLL